MTAEPDVAPAYDSTPAGATSPRPADRVWLVVLGVLGATALLYVAAPDGTHRPLRAAFDLLAGGSIVLAIRVRRPAHATPWWFVAAAVLSSAVGDTLQLYYDAAAASPPFPALYDVAYLAIYPLLAVAFVVIARNRTPGRHSGHTVDALAMSTAAGLLGAIYGMAPHLRETGFTPLQQVVSLAYPSMDVFLLTLGLVLVVTGRIRERAFLLLWLAVAVQLVTDVAFAAIALHGEYRTGTLVDSGWMLTTAALAAAAWHPTMPYVARPVAGGEFGARLGLGRLGLLFAAALTFPAVLVSPAVRDELTLVPAVAVTATILLLLVFARLYLVAREAEVAESERARRELAESAALEAANLARRQTQFATMAAHELRSPLTALRGSLATLRIAPGRLAAEQQDELVGIALRQSERLVRICADLEVVVHSDVERLGVRTEPVDVGQVVEQVLAGIDAATATRVVATADPAAVAVADRDRLGQVLDNLLRNAAQYAPEGSIRVRAARAGDRVTIEVTDEGPGLSREVAAEAFERFGLRSADATGGFGIGLWVVRELVTAMGGEVGYAPREGGGAAFRVTLPAAG